MPPAHRETARGDSPIFFWYDREEPAYHEYCALNGTYISEFSRISEHFPAGCPERDAKGSLVVVNSWRGAWRKSRGAHWTVAGAAPA